MYKDYLSNIIETGFIQDIIEGKYSIEEIKQYIEKIKTEGNITKEVEKIYLKIEKDYIEKNKKITILGLQTKQRKINMTHKK